MNGDPAVVRVYRRLVGLYPRQFRDDYGADMVQLLRDQCVDDPTWRVLCRVVAAGVGVDAWFLGVIFVLVAFVLTGIGALLGVVRLTNRRSRNGTLPT